MNFKEPAFLILVTAMLVGCSEPNKPDVTIPAGVVLSMEVNHIGDTLIGKILPADEDKSGFGEVSKVTAALIKGNCSLGLPLTWDTKINRHFASVGILACDGIERVEFSAILIDSATRMVGLKSVALGNTVSVLVTKPTHVK